MSGVFAQAPEKMREYEDVKRIGRGNFGVVTLVRSRSDGRLYVRKTLQLDQLSETEKKGAHQEVLMLQALKRHPMIVRYKDSFLAGESLNIIMNYCEGGDLASRIKGAKDNFPEETIMLWFAQIALAIRFCHKHHIIHRDIKSQNIFLTRRGEIKLGDFGIARVLYGTSELATTVVGTPFSMSPEVCENKPYSKPSDIWAMGCVLYEMCMLRHAFDANNLLGLVWKIVQQKQPDIPKMYSKDLRSLIDSMLDKDPTRRPTIQQILDLDVVKRRADKVIDYYRRQRRRSEEAHAARAARVQQRTTPRSPPRPVQGQPPSYQQPGSPPQPRSARGPVGSPPRAESGVRRQSVKQATLRRLNSRMQMRRAGGVTPRGVTVAGGLVSPPGGASSSLPGGMGPGPAVPPAVRQQSPNPQPRQQQQQQQSGLSKADLVRIRKERKREEERRQYALQIQQNLAEQKANRELAKQRMAAELARSGDPKPISTPEPLQKSISAPGEVPSGGGNSARGPTPVREARAQSIPSSAQRDGDGPLYDGPLRSPVARAQTAVPPMQHAYGGDAGAAAAPPAGAQSARASTGRSYQWEHAQPPPSHRRQPSPAGFQQQPHQPQLQHRGGYPDVAQPYPHSASPQPAQPRAPVGGLGGARPLRINNWETSPREGPTGGAPGYGGSPNLGPSPSSRFVSPRDERPIRSKGKYVPTEERPIKSSGAYDLSMVLQGKPKQGPATPSRRVGAGRGAGGGARGGTPGSQIGSDEEYEDDFEDDSADFDDLDESGRGSNGSRGSRGGSADAKRRRAAVATASMRAPAATVSSAKIDNLRKTLVRELGESQFREMYGFIQRSREAQTLSKRAILERFGKGTEHTGFRIEQLIELESVFSHKA